MKLIHRFIPLLACSLLAVVARGQDSAPPENQQPGQPPQTTPAPEVPSPPSAQATPPQNALAPAAGAKFRERYGVGGAAGGIGGGGQNFSDRLRNIITRAETGPQTGPLIIRSSGMDTKEQENLEQDLEIMAHILDKALEESPGTTAPFRAMGIDVFHSGGSAGPRAAYIDGYGALFTLEVGFPLLAPPSRGEPEKEQPAGSSTWEEARQELYGGPNAAIDPTTGLPAGSNPAFNEERVNHLREALLGAMQNASNIRGLKSDDSVTVCVVGGNIPAPVRGGYGPSPHAWHAPVDPTTGLPNGGMAARNSVMTIRLKKGDLDTLAKAKGGIERLRKAAHIETYVAAGGGEGPRVFGAMAGAGGF